MQLNIQEIVLNDIWLKGALWDNENGFLLEPTDFKDSCRMPRIYMKPSSFMFASDYQGACDMHHT